MLITTDKSVQQTGRAVLGLKQFDTAIVEILFSFSSDSDFPTRIYVSAYQTDSRNLAVNTGRLCNRGAVVTLHVTLIHSYLL